MSGPRARNAAPRPRIARDRRLLRAPARRARPRNAEGRLVFPGGLHADVTNDAGFRRLGFLLRAPELHRAPERAGLPCLEGIEGREGREGSKDIAIAAAQAARRCPFRGARDLLVQPMVIHLLHSLVPTIYFSSTLFATGYLIRRSDF